MKTPFLHEHFFLAKKKKKGLNLPAVITLQKFTKGIFNVEDSWYYKMSSKYLKLILKIPGNIA